jgi:hypothetical protein
MGLRPDRDGDTLCPVIDRSQAVVGRLWACVRPEPVMTLPRCAADVLADHVTFEVECIDRMYLNVYQPRLQHPRALVGYIHNRLERPVASTVALAPISEAFVASIQAFARNEGVPVVHFAKGQRKDDIMHEHLARFTADEGVVFIGRAQEKAPVFRTEKRRDAAGGSYPWIVRTTGIVNQWYFYCVDADFGPFFVKFSSYFPYNAKLCINGNEWAKRQAAKAGIGFTALDNGFAAVDDAAALQTICDQLGPDKIDALLRKWLAILPHPFSPADRAAGYRYDISILQAEFSLTQMLDRPVAGRIFFDQIIANNLDIGRPDQVSLVFDRRIHRRGPRATPGRFRTRIITDGVTPSLHVDYKHSKIKQYHKLGRALRTETTINETKDFGIGKRLHNLPALARIGFTANRRLLDVQQLSHNPITGADAFAQTNNPIVAADGSRVPGLRFADPRTQALLAALCVFRLIPDGFANRDLRALIAPLLGRPAEAITAGQMTYDLRRLRLHGLIERIPHTFRYQVTDIGLAHAMFLTRLHDRLLRTGLAEITDPAPPLPSRLRTADRTYTAAIDELARHAGIAA